MTPEKVLEVIDVYRKFFEEKHIPKNKISKEDFDLSLMIYSHRRGILVSFEHCHAMLDEMEQFTREGRMEKVFRWLGFVQGVLWLSGSFTLNELKNHSRP